MSETILKGDFLEAFRDGAVATVRFKREQQKNALSVALLHELETVTRMLSVDASLSAVVLTGGSQVFSAGADKKDPQMFGDLTAQDQRLGLISRTGLARAWAELPQVTIAAIEGYAVGGALTLALCCDFRVMSEDAFLYVPEIDMGMPYGWNSLPRLNALIGPALTKRLVMFAERVPAAQAMEWRLADFISPKGLTQKEATERAYQLAAKPRLALEIIKRSTNAYQNAMAHLVGHADSDQAVFCRLALENDSRLREATGATSRR
jgi:enoyl-CoA hydratase